MKSKKILIKEALSQMIGYKLGKWGADIDELVSGMGLSKEEWDYIKKNENCGHLDEEDVHSIDEYFKIRGER